ncbi:MAG TPA: hypothetical protein VIJ94_10615 [Caulobacteraceae bacterium]
MSADPHDPAEAEDEMEHLGQDLKTQMNLARDRIADRYAKLMEERTFDPPSEAEDPGPEPEPPATAGEA